MSAFWAVTGNSSNQLTPKEVWRIQRRCLARIAAFRLAYSESSRRVDMQTHTLKNPGASAAVVGQVPFADARPIERRIGNPCAVTGDLTLVGPDRLFPEGHFGGGNGNFTCPECGSPYEPDF